MISNKNYLAIFDLPKSKRPNDMTINPIKGLQCIKSTFSQFHKPIICLLFLLTFSCYKYERSKESLDYLNSPKVGDIYFFEKENENIYYPLKVKQVERDSIIFLKSQIELSLKYYVDETNESIKKDLIDDFKFYDYWTEETEVIRKNKIHSLFDKNLIFEIKRY